MQDHADCERKASSMAMSFIAKYPDRPEIIPELMDIAIEELQHFKQIYTLMESKGVPMPAKMGEDLYVKQLVKLCRSGREDRFLDRLIVAGVVETRGAERFRMVAEAQIDEEAHKFYQRLWKSEERHGEVFIRMAMNYFSEEEVYERLAFFIEKEGEIISNLPLKPALH